MTLPIRINIYGGPGTGKSVLAADIFSKLKKSGHKVELVQEFIKTWAWQGKDVQDFDQLYIFTQQMKRELDLLRAGVSVVTDSPLLLNLCYVHKYNQFLFPALRRLSNEFDQRWPSNTIALKRTILYQQEGRYEDEQEAKHMDLCIRAMLIQELGRSVPWFDPIGEQDLIHSRVQNLFNSKNWGG